MDNLETRIPHLVCQYRARAQLVRGTADEMTRATMRRQLLRIAEEYEWLAERIEGDASCG